MGSQAPTCTDAMHVECAGLTEIPEGSWFCPKHSTRKRGAAKGAQAPSSEPDADPTPPNGTAQKPPLPKSKSKKR